MIMISYLMKQILSDIIKNKNEKLFQNYLMLLKLVTKQQKTSNDIVLNSRDYYSKVLKDYLDTNDIDSLVFVFEVID